ncbi:MAG: disulfide bond formation protein B [Burkholderiales bacterium]|jgi:disulfide bond formation protein DsbB|nr:disulfide bond formation protein B [Burkholderiales bacterium]
MTPTAELSRRLTPRALLALIVAAVVLAMGGGLYFQHVLQLEPCPLCVLQRMAFVGVGLFAALGLLAGGAGGQLAAALLATACAATGAAIAGWHSWILAYPPESMSCGRPFEWFHDDFPLAVWLPKLFAGHGDCLAVDWTFLGLAIPHMSLIAFVLLIGATGLVVARTWPRRRAARADRRA